jgi:toxin ParE1/3/4
MSVPNRAVTLSPEARIDFTDILIDTELRWGTNQRDRYAAKLVEAIDVLGEYPAIGRRRAELHPDLRSHPAGEHTLFYRVKESSVEIVRILHQHADAARALGR